MSTKATNHRFRASPWDARTLTISPVDSGGTDIGGAWDWILLRDAQFAGVEVSFGGGPFTAMPKGFRFRPPLHADGTAQKLADIRVRQATGVTPNGGTDSNIITLYVGVGDIEDYRSLFADPVIVREKTVRRYYANIPFSVAVAVGAPSRTYFAQLTAPSQTFGLYTRCRLLEARVTSLAFTGTATVYTAIGISRVRSGAGVSGGAAAFPAAGAAGTPWYLPTGEVRFAGLAKSTVQVLNSPPPISAMEHTRDTNSVAGLTTGDFLPSCDAAFGGIELIPTTGSTTDFAAGVMECVAVWFESNVTVLGTLTGICRLMWSEEEVYP